MPVAVHPNSIDGIFQTAPQTAGGTPTYYPEWHAGLTQVFQANVISLVCQGTFELFPDLKVVITEGGSDDAVIRCPWHGWEFELATGRAMFNPDGMKVRTYPVRVVDDRVVVEL